MVVGNRLSVSFRGKSGCTLFNKRFLRTTFVGNLEPDFQRGPFVARVRWKWLRVSTGTEPSCKLWVSMFERRPTVDGVVLTVRCNSKRAAIFVRNPLTQELLTINIMCGISLDNVVLLECGKHMKLKRVEYSTAPPGITEATKVCSACDYHWYINGLTTFYQNEKEY